MTADGDRPAPPEPRRTHSDVVWQPRENADVGGSVAQYSRLVARLKIALPVLAGLILLLVLVLPQIRSESERFRIGLKNVGDLASDTLSMRNARYFGTDDNGQPYQVTAATVHERPEANADGTKLIDLTDPRAELKTDTGKRVNLNATTGVYDRKQEILDLGGQVDLVQDDGTEMHTTAAQVHLKESVATGNAPVTAKGSFGTIQATGFTARKNQKTLFFTGPATLVLQNSDKSGSPQANTEPKPEPKSEPKGEAKP
jgi:lipopolysaccharide export system protein LptC